MKDKNANIENNINLSLSIQNKENKKINRNQTILSLNSYIKHSYQQMYM